MAADGGADRGRPLRVLTMLDSIVGIGGAETMALETCAGLAADGFGSYLCLTRWDPELRTTEPAASRLAELEARGIRVIGLPRRGRIDLRHWAPLLRFLREHRIDVLHSHMFGSNVWGSVIGTLARTPVVVAHEHMWSFEGAAGRRFADRRVIGRLADAFIAVSDLARRRMIEIERVPAGKVVLIRNGIPALQEVDPGAARRMLGLDADALVVSSVGLLRPEKAFDVLIRASAMLAGAHPSLVVLIAGEGSERTRLEDLVAELGLEGRVRLLGYRQDVPELLAASDICVCSSLYEGGPLSVMEYMAAGRPVVATRAGGLPELVEPELTGLLVEPRDPVGLSVAMGRLAADEALRKRLGEAGRARATRDLSLDRSLAEVKGLYRRLAAEKGVRVEHSA